MAVGGPHRAVERPVPGIIVLFFIVCFGVLFLVFLSFFLPLQDENVCSQLTRSVEGWPATGRSFRFPFFLFFFFVKKNCVPFLGVSSCLLGFALEQAEKKNTMHYRTATTGWNAPPAVSHDAGHCSDADAGVKAVVLRTKTEKQKKSDAHCRHRPPAGPPPASAVSLDASSKTIRRKRKKREKSKRKRPREKKKVRAGQKGGGWWPVGGGGLEECGRVGMRALNRRAGRQGRRWLKWRYLWTFPGTRLSERPASSQNTRKCASSSKRKAQRRLDGNSGRRVSLFCSVARQRTSFDVGLG